MKVTVEDFKAALALFEAEALGTMKTTLQKFLAGAIIASKSNEIDALLRQNAVDNLIDTDAVRAIVDAGFRQSNGQIDIPINFGVLGAIGATPTTITIRKNDMDNFFDKTIPSVAKNMG